MPVQVSYKKQFLFGIMYVALVLVIIEGFVNFWWYFLNTCSFENNEIFANLDDETKRELCIESIALQQGDIRVSKFEGKTVTINSEGFRGPEITKSKPDNTFRIFTVGGSTTIGAGVLDHQTYPFYLQEKFHDNKTRTEKHNLL